MQPWLLCRPPKTAIDRAVKLTIKFPDDCRVVRPPSTAVAVAKNSVSSTVPVHREYFFFMRATGAVLATGDG